MATFLFGGNTPEVLGIESFTRVRRSLGADVLTVTLARDAVGSFPYSHGQTMTVTKNGAMWFTGTVMRPVRRMDGRGQGGQITVQGVWWKLERTPYLNTFPARSRATSTNTGGRVSIFLKPENGDAETTSQSLSRVLSRAQSFMASTVPSLFPRLYAPPEKATDRSLAQSILGVMRYHLDWGTYVSGRVLTFVKRGSARKSFEIGNIDHGVEDPRPVIRQDLAPAGVVLRYEREGDAQASDGYRAAVGVDKYPSGVEPGQTNVLVETITLRQGEPVPRGGLAKEFYDALGSQPIVEGSSSFVDESCDTGLHPGSTVNFYGLNSPTEWATMNAMVSEVRETPFQGRTEVTFGLPPSMGLRDWVDLMRFQNRWRARDELASRDTPVDPPPSTPLTPYLTKRNSDNAWVLRMTPGEWSDGLTRLTPYWDTLPYTLDTPNVTMERVLARGGQLEVFMFVEYNPQAELFQVMDAEGGLLNQYLGTGAGTTTTLRVVFEIVAPRLPQVNPESGSVVTGRYFFRYGIVTWPIQNPAPTLRIIRKGNFQLLHQPPQRMYLIPEETVE